MQHSLRHLRSCHLRPQQPLSHQVLIGHQRTNMMISSSLWKSVDSWFTLQGIPERAGELENPVRLDYVLNFLGNQGRRRYDHWQPTGADAEAQKKSASAFLDHLQSTMDHDISIRCRIYKLEGNPYPAR